MGTSVEAVEGTFPWQQPRPQEQCAASCQTSTPSTASDAPAAACNTPDAAPATVASAPAAHRAPASAGARRQLDSKLVGGSPRQAHQAPSHDGPGVETGRCEGRWSRHLSTSGH